MTPPRQWLQLRHLAAATGIDRRTLKTWADNEVLPFTRFSGNGWRLFGADAIAKLEGMGIPVRMSVLTVLANPTDDAPDEKDEED